MQIFFTKKGFDIIIANPPYVEFKLLDLDYKKLGEYYSAKGKYDLYVVFTEKCLKLINQDGLICLIQPTF